MKITISNFMGCAQQSYIFADGSFILIRGKSGIGKTTILEAISWCLYKKIRGVSPRQNPTARTIVSLELSLSSSVMLTVTRQRGPGLLTVTLSGGFKYHLAGTYQDSVGQSIIDDILGNSDVWQCSSYVQQDERNMFLSSNNTGRMEILTRLAFKSDDPSAYTSKINERISVTTKDYESINAVLTSKIQEYNTQATTVDFSHCLSPESINEINARLGSLNAELECITAQQYQRDVLLKELETLTAMKAEAIRTVESLVVPSEVPYITEDMDQLVKLQYLLQKLFTLRKTMPNANIVEVSPQHASLTEGSLVYIDSHCQEYQRSSNTCTGLGIEYNEVSLDQYIKSAQRSIDQHQQWSIYLQIQSLEAQCSSIVVPPEKTFVKPDAPVMQDISQYQKEIDTISSSIEVVYKRISQLAELSKQLSQYTSDVNRLAQLEGDLLKLGLFTGVEPTRPVAVDESATRIALELQLRELQGRDKLLIETLICPSCKQGLELRHDDGKLHAFNLTEAEVTQQRATIANEIETVRTQLGKINDSQQQYMLDVKQYDSAVREYNAAKSQYTSAHTNITSEISVLKSRMVPVDLTAEEITGEYNTLSLEYQQLNSSKQSLTEAHNKEHSAYSNAMAQYQLECTNIEREHREYDNMRSRCNAQKESLNQQIESTKKLLVNVPEGAPAVDLVTLQNNLAKARTVRVIESPSDKYGVASVAQARDVLTHIRTNKLLIELGQQLKDLESELTKVNCDPVLKSLSDYEITRVIESIRQYFADNVKYSQSRTLWMHKIQDIETRISGIAVPQDMSTRVSEIGVEKSTIENRLKMAERANKVATMYYDVADVQKKATDLHARLTNLHTLKARSMDVECYLLQKTVDQINQSISDVIGSLFDEHITVQIQLYKMDKKLNAKPCVNFLIDYKGCEMDSIARLSGGEKTRVSLALTLALSRMSTCPFVMLDEILHNVDDDTKEVSIEAIRSVIGHKCILFVGYGLVEGHYDGVLTM